MLRHYVPRNDVRVGELGFDVRQSFSVYEKLSKFFGKMTYIMRAEDYGNMRELAFKGCCTAVALGEASDDADDFT